MAKNPYTEGYRRDAWEMGATGARQNHDEYFTKAPDEIGDDWWRGYVATMLELLVQPEHRFLAGFDAGLEAAQEHSVAGDGRDWKEIATHLLAQVIDRRIAGGWQRNAEDAARNAIEYHRLEIRDHLDLARRHIDRIHLTRETP